MTPYFHTPERIDQLRAVAQSWIGTPFHPNGRVKGSGVSCQMFPPMLYLELGFMSSKAACEIPEGPMNWGHAQRESLIEPYIDNQLRDYFASIEPSEPLPGDLLGFKVGGCIHHIGVCTGRSFVHAMPTYGVCECRIDDATWLTRLRRIWRPVIRFANGGFVEPSTVLAGVAHRDSVMPRSVVEKLTVENLNGL